MMAPSQAAAWHDLLRSLAADLPQGRRPAPESGAETEDREGLAVTAGLLLIPLPPGGGVPAGVTVLREAENGLPFVERGDRVESGSAVRRWAVAPGMTPAQRNAFPGWLVREWARALTPATLLSALGMVAILLGVFGTFSSVSSLAGAGCLLLVAGGLAASGLAWRIAADRGASLGERTGWYLRTAALDRLLRQPRPASGIPEPVTTTEPGMLASVDMVTAIAVRQLSPLVAIASAALLVGTGAVALTSSWVALLLPLAVLGAGIGLWLTIPSIIRHAAAALATAEQGRATLASALTTQADAAGAEAAAQATLRANARSRQAALPLLSFSPLMPLLLVIAVAAWPGDASPAGIAAAVTATIAIGSLCATLAQESCRVAASLAPLAHAWALLGTPMTAATPIPWRDGIRLAGIALPGRPGLPALDLEIGLGAKLTLHAAEPTLAALASILTGRVPPATGRIEPLAPSSPERKRTRFAYIPASLVLPAGSLQEIVTGPSDASDATRDQVVAKVGLDRALRFMPLGWTTPVYGDAPWLDPALRCRLLLARAILKEPGLLVIDRALDTLLAVDRAPLLALLGTLSGSVVILTTLHDCAIPGGERHTMDEGSTIDQPGPPQVAAHTLE